MYQSLSLSNGKFLVTLYQMGVSQSKYQFHYSLAHEGKLLLSGKDFYCPTNDIKAFTSVLSFLTLRLGDTDDEFFKNYSDEVLEFIKSAEGELFLFEALQFSEAVVEGHITIEKSPSGEIVRLIGLPDGCEFSTTEKPFIGVDSNS